MTYQDWVFEKQPEGIQFTDRDGRVTIHDFNLNLDDNDDNDGNASDKSLTMTKNIKRNSRKKVKM